MSDYRGALDYRGVGLERFAVTKAKKKGVEDPLNMTCTHQKYSLALSCSPITKCTIIIYNTLTHTTIATS